MKLLIGIPSLDFVHVDFVECLTKLIQRLKDDKVNFDLWICKGTLAHVARDKIACKAINEGYTHVLWLDADMIFTPNILDDLMFCGKDFVTGLACCRRPPFVLCIFDHVSERKGCTYYDLANVPDEAFEIQGCGFACVLITTAILKQVMLTYKTCFLPEKIFGEDVAFCVRARQLGHKIYCEPSVRLGHIGHNAVWPGEHERYMAEMQKG